MQGFDLESGVMLSKTVQFAFTVNPGQEGNVELPTISPTDTKLSNEDSGQVRQFFPESWLFTLQQTE